MTLYRVAKRMDGTMRISYSTKAILGSVAMMMALASPAGAQALSNNPFVFQWFDLFNKGSSEGT